MMHIIWYENFVHVIFYNLKYNLWLFALVLF